MNVRSIIGIILFVAGLITMNIISFLFPQGGIGTPLDGLVMITGIALFFLGFGIVLGNGNSN